MKTIFYGINREIARTASTGLYLTSEDKIVDHQNLTFKAERGIMINDDLYLDLTDMPEVSATAQDAISYCKMKNYQLPTLADLIELQQVTDLVNAAIGKVRPKDILSPLLLPQNVTATCWAQETVERNLDYKEARRVIFLKKRSKKAGTASKEFCDGKIVIVENKKSYKLVGGAYKACDFILWAVCGRMNLLSINDGNGSTFLFYCDPQTKELNLMCADPQMIGDEIVYSEKGYLCQIGPNGVYPLYPGGWLPTTGETIKRIVFNKNGAMQVDVHSSNPLSGNNLDSKIIFVKDAEGIFRTLN